MATWRCNEVTASVGTSCSIWVGVVGVVLHKKEKVKTMQSTHPNMRILILFLSVLLLMAVSNSRAAEKSAAGDVAIKGYDPVAYFLVGKAVTPMSAGGHMRCTLRASPRIARTFIRGFRELNGS